ncbi:ATP-dependent DNA ligase, partial [Mesorhizobium sp. M7A.T.Ca.TU.009.01.1.1]
MHEPINAFPLPLDTSPMEAKLADEIPRDGNRWQYEPKWDGFRCLAFKSDDTVDLRAKSGKPLGRYFPEITDILRDLKCGHFVIDGEIVIDIDGELSFEALQMRLHPAQSRIRKLSSQTPASLILFDMLARPGGEVITGKPLVERRRAIEDFVTSSN